MPQLPPLSHEQLHLLIAPMVEACFKPPLDSHLRDAAEHFVAHRFLTYTKHATRTEDLGYDISTYTHGTRKPYELSDYSNVQDFLDEPYTTEATFTSGAGFRARSHGEDLEDDVYYPTVHQLIFETLAAINPENLSVDPHLRLLRSQLPFREGDAHLDLHDSPLTEDLYDMISDNFYTDLSIQWMQNFLDEPLEPIIRRQAERIRLEQEERAALRRIETQRAAQLRELATNILNQLGPAAKKKYGMHNQEEAKALLSQAFHLGATKETALALLDYLRFNQKLKMHAATWIRNHEP